MARTKRHSDGEEYLRRANIDDTTAERRGFWDEFHQERGYESMRVIDLHETRLNRQGEREHVYARSIPTTYDALDIYNLAVRSGIKPREFLRKTTGSASDARLLEFMANKISHDTGRKMFIEEKGFTKFKVAPGPSQAKHRGLTEKTAQFLVSARQSIEQHLRTDEKGGQVEYALRAGQQAYVLVERDGKVDPNSKRQLTGYGTWRDDPRWTRVLGDRRPSPEETYEDDAEDSGHAIDVYVYVKRSPNVPPVMQPVVQAKPAIAATNRKIGARLSRIHALKGTLANEQTKLLDDVRKGFKP